MVEEIIISLYRNGGRRFLLLNAHGGNYAALLCVAQKLQAQLPILLAVCNWWDIAKDELSKLRSSEPGGAGHGGELETSLMMFLAPHLVKVSEFKKHIPKVPELFFPRDMLRQGEKKGAAVFLKTETLSPTGHLGDPTVASADKGARFWEAIVNCLSEFLIEYGKCPIPGKCKW